MTPILTDSCDESSGRDHIREAYVAVEAIATVRKSSRVGRLARAVVVKRIQKEICFKRENRLWAVGWP